MRNRYFIQKNNLAKLFYSHSLNSKTELELNNVYHTIVRDESGQIMMDNANVTTYVTNMWLCFSYLCFIYTKAFGK